MAALGTARRTPLVAKARPVTVCSPVVVATQVAPVVPTSLPVAVPSVAFDSFATAPVPSQHPSHASPYLPPPQAAAPPVHGGGGEQVVGMVLPGPFPQQAGYGFAYPPFLATPAVSPAPALRPPLILSAQPQPQPQEPALAGFTAVSAPPPAAAPVTCTLARERALAAAPPAAEPEAEVAARAVLEDEGLLSAALALVEASSGGPSACSSPRSQIEGHNACSPHDLSCLDGHAFASDPNAHHPTPKQPRSSSQSQPSRGRASHYNAAKIIDRLHLSPGYQRGDASRSRSGRDSPGLALHRTVGVPRRAKNSPEVSPLATLRRNSPGCGIARRSPSLHGSPLHSRASSDATLSPIDGSFQLTPDFGKLWSLPQKWVRKEPNAARVVAGARVGADSMDTSTD